MDRIAVFVDAGYLFAQGSVAVSGEKRPRTAINFDPAGAVTALKTVAAAAAPKCDLLRIYWYDGAIAGSRPTSDQALLASLNDVKLRLGFVNSHGQQKGVDSLIVTDLIELARLKSIADALLLSGDEDVRIGVQIAQNYGVRVHLLGIHPARGSQSVQLMQEADTTLEWTAAIIGEFVRIGHEAEATDATLGAPMEPVDVQSVPTAVLESIKHCVSVFVRHLADADLTAIAAYWKDNRGVPPDLDKRLLPACATAAGRLLEKAETKQMRIHFSALVRSRLAAMQPVKLEE